MSLIDLTNYIGTYQPLLDPVTGSVVQGMAGVDWTYIGRFIIFLVIITVFLTLIASFLKALARR
jgi:hypothetical protein